MLTNCTNLFCTRNWRGKKFFRILKDGGAISCCFSYYYLCL